MAGRASRAEVWRRLNEAERRKIPRGDLDALVRDAGAAVTVAIAAYLDAFDRQVALGGLDAEERRADRLHELFDAVAVRDERG